jgi:hypothetical protein
MSSLAPFKRPWWPLLGRLWAATFTLAIASCAQAPGSTAPQSSPEWQPVALPGKASTSYRPAEIDGRRAILAESERSASMLRKRVEMAPERLGEVSFSWWVENLVPGASVSDIDREDAPARVLFGFDGDVTTLPARTRLMFDLATALTGEAPPYATLMYVWDASAPVGSVVVNPRTDRIRKIVVDSGPLQLRRWRDHRRDLAADFRLAFGEESGALRSIAVMADSDNTRSQARAFFGAVTLH